MLIFKVVEILQHLKEWQDTLISSPLILYVILLSLPLWI